MKTAQTRRFSTKTLNHLLEKLRHAVTHFPKENNPQYRNFYLKSDISQIQIVVLVLGLTIALFAVSDHMFFGFSPTFYGLVALRASLILFSIIYLKHVTHLKNHKTYDNSTLLYMLITVAGILTVNLTRPENFVPHIIVIDMAVFTYYLLLPTRFIYQATASLTFSIGEILIITTTFQSLTEVPALFTAIFSLIFANLIAALSSLQLHLYRWHMYKNIQKRKETERLAAIGQTAGMIGHDIRNPLQAINNELYVAKQAMKTYPTEETKDALESIGIIQEQTDYISKIVSDLQDYARPLKPEYTQVNLSDLLSSIFQTITLSKKITLKINLKDITTLQTDPTFLRRALTNLVNNALQAMQNGGTLQLSATKMDPNAIITVTDTGEGIPEDVKARLFTPLLTTKAKGQGLGLAVVKRLIEALDGTVTFESQQGKGTTFTITLPLKHQT
jgi:signal transduction histidine kinase